MDEPEDCVCGGGYGYYAEFGENDECTGREIYCTCPKGEALRKRETSEKRYGVLVLAHRRTF